MLNTQPLFTSSLYSPSLQATSSEALSAGSICASAPAYVSAASAAQNILSQLSTLHAVTEQVISLQNTALQTAQYALSTLQTTLPATFAFSGMSFPVQALGQQAQAQISAAQSSLSVLSNNLRGLAQSCIAQAQTVVSELMRWAQPSAWTQPAAWSQSNAFGQNPYVQNRFAQGFAPFAHALPFQGIQSFSAQAPFAAFSPFATSFSPFSASYAATGIAGQTVTPSISVSETDSAIEIQAEMPGVNDKTVEVYYRDGILNLRGRSAARLDDEQATSLHCERPSNVFQRAIPLNIFVDEDKIKASVVDGIVHITLPKTRQGSKSGNVTRISTGKAA